MAHTRAKFRCNWVRDHGDNKLVQLGVVYSRIEGTENYDFTKATPSGTIEMQIDNPAAAVQFKPTRYYYVDFTECAEDPEAPGYRYKPENLNPV
jgi:hypothetical protein